MTDVGIFPIENRSNPDLHKMQIVYLKIRVGLLLKAFKSTPQIGSNFCFVHLRY